MEGLTAFLQIGAFLVAFGTLFKGLSEYSKNNGFKRAEILEKLIDKFKNSDKLVAKNILEDMTEAYYDTIDASDNRVKQIEKRSKDCNNLTFVHIFYGNSCIVVERIDDEKTTIIDKIEIKQGDMKTDNFLGVISVKTLIKYFQRYKGATNITFIGIERLLRTHRGQRISTNEIYYRDSFDELLDFCLLLTYYLRNEVITIREVEAHFSYYLRLIRDNKAVEKYIIVYYNYEDFKWLFDQLPEKIS